MLIGALALLAVGSLITLAIVLVGGEDASAPGDPGAITTTSPSAEAAGEVLIDGSTVGTGEVLLEPVGVPTVDAFTDQVLVRQPAGRAGGRRHLRARSGSPTVTARSSGRGKPSARRSGRRGECLLDGNAIRRHPGRHLHGV